MSAEIDVTFDFRSDTPVGKDPDAHSATLRLYHRVLWSKPLPSGARFELDGAVRGHYLVHRSDLGEFSLTSDSVVPTFRWNARVRAMVSAERLASFVALGYTIGGMMVFPGKRIDGKWTINQARGCTRKIADRFDLTLECIRRHYCDVPSPLSDVLARHAGFFALFGDFRGYVEFFLLQDLVSTDFSAVIISPPFDDFASAPIPKDVEEYGAYERAARAFIDARNRRIARSRAVPATEPMRVSPGILPT